MQENLLVNGNVKSGSPYHHRKCSLVPVRMSEYHDVHRRLILQYSVFALPILLVWKRVQPGD
jgi:hypothetical protein